MPKNCVVRLPSANPEQKRREIYTESGLLAVPAEKSQSLSDVEPPPEDEEEEPSSHEPTTSAASRAIMGKHLWHRRGSGGSADSLKNWRRI